MIIKIALFVLIFAFIGTNEIKAMEVIEEISIIEESIIEESLIEESIIEESIVEESIEIDTEDSTIDEEDTTTNEEEDSIVEEEDDEIKEEEVIDLEEYYLFLDMIEELEEYAKSYIIERNKDTDKLRYGKQKLIYTYIRSKRYNSSLWQYCAGSIDTNFDKYVKEKNSKLEELKNLKDITIPNGEKVDIVHMFASIDMEREGYGCVGSWGGDLVQVIQKLKDNKGTKEELYELFKNSINVPGYFSNEDINADLDAFNLYKRIRKETSKTIRNIIEDYYLELTNELRVNEFIDNKYSFETYNNENLRQKIEFEFIYDRFIDLLLEQRGISKSQHIDHIIVSLEVFSDYLYEFYNGKQVNNKKEEVSDKKEEEKDKNKNEEVNNQTTWEEEIIEEEIQETIVNKGEILKQENTNYEKEVKETIEETIEETIIEEEFVEEITSEEESIIKIENDNKEEIETLEEDELIISIKEEEKLIKNELLFTVACVFTILLFMLFAKYSNKEEDDFE